MSFHVWPCVCMRACVEGLSGGAGVVAGPVAVVLASARTACRPRGRQTARTTRRCATDSVGWIWMQVVWRGRKAFADKVASVGGERVRKITIGLGSPPMSARVHMEAVDDSAVRVMASLCPYLTAIELHGCDGVTNAGLLALAHGAEMLERVSLPSGRNITAKGLAALAACRSLKEVRISWAEHLGDDALEALAECTSLTTISLDACTGVGDAGVAALASGCGSALTSITLSGCDQVADGGLQALADGCPRLTSIVASSCPSVTSAGIIALADSCPQLTAVDVSDCERVGDEALAALIGCPRLETLRVAMCPSVSAAGLRKVCKDEAGDQQMRGHFAAFAVAQIVLQRFGECFHAGLGNIVGRVARWRRDALFRAGIDDQAGLAKFDHARRDGLYAVDDPPEIDVYNPLPVLRGPEDLAARLYARIVHQHVDGAESAENIAFQSFQVFHPADVALARHHVRRSIL